jgi:hypothetical protein
MILSYSGDFSPFVVARITKGDSNLGEIYWRRRRRLGHMANSQAPWRKRPLARANGPEASSGATVTLCCEGLEADLRRRQPQTPATALEMLGKLLIYLVVLEALGISILWLAGLIPRGILYAGIGVFVATVVAAFGTVTALRRRIGQSDSSATSRGVPRGR